MTLSDTDFKSEKDKTVVIKTIFLLAKRRKRPPQP